MEINAAKLPVEFVKHAVVACAEFEFRTALQPLVRNSSSRVPISSILRYAASRMAGGKSSNVFEKVGDQIWSAATFHLGWRVV